MKTALLVLGVALTGLLIAVKVSLLTFAMVTGRPVAGMVLLRHGVSVLAPASGCDWCWKTLKAQNHRAAPEQSPGSP